MLLHMASKQRCHLIGKGPFCLLMMSVAACSVGHFKEMVLWCEQCPERTRAVQKVLKVVRGWEAAATHAKKAVTEDVWPRMFSTDSGTVLLYPCKHGKVDMTRIIGETGMPHFSITSLETRSLH